MTTGDFAVSARRRRHPPREGAFEDIAADCLRFQRMPHRRALVDHDDAGNPDERFYRPCTLISQRALQTRIGQGDLAEGKFREAMLVHGIATQAVKSGGKSSRSSAAASSACRR